MLLRNISSLNKKSPSIDSSTTQAFPKPSPLPLLFSHLNIQKLV